MFRYFSLFKFLEGPLDGREAADEERLEDFLELPPLASPRPLEEELEEDEDEDAIGTAIATGLGLPTRAAFATSRLACLIHSFCKFLSSLSFDLSLNTWT